MLDIKGLKKEDLLIELFNNAVYLCDKNENNLSLNEAEEILNKTTFVTLVKGRILNVDLTDDDMFDEKNFDMRYGKGLSKKIVKELRSIDDNQKIYMKNKFNVFCLNLFENSVFYKNDYQKLTKNNQLFMKRLVCNSSLSYIYFIDKIFENQISDEYKYLLESDKDYKKTLDLFTHKENINNSVVKNMRNYIKTVDIKNKEICNLILEEYEKGELDYEKKAFYMSFLLTIFKDNKEKVADKTAVFDSILLEKPELFNKSSLMVNEGIRNQKWLYLKHLLNLNIDDQQDNSYIVDQMFLDEGFNETIDYMESVFGVNDEVKVRSRKIV